MKKVIATPDAPKAVGPYSQAIEVNGTLYISGQIPVNPADGKVQEDIVAAAHQSLKNIGAILKEAGMTYDNVVKTTVLLADIADFKAVNEVYAEYFTGSNLSCKYEFLQLLQRHIIETFFLVQRTHCLHVLIIELKIEDGDFFLNPY